MSDFNEITIKKVGNGYIVTKDDLGYIETKVFTYIRELINYLREQIEE